jgi:hypothetical protein
VKFNIFRPPAEPLPGMKVLKMSTVCCGMYCNGELIKWKLWIVVKGCGQIPGVHFNETYTLVMKWATFRMILSIGASINAVIHQFDVKSAYLHGIMKRRYGSSSQRALRSQARSTWLCICRRHCMAQKRVDMSGISLCSTLYSTS